MGKQYYSAYGVLYHGIVGELIEEYDCGCARYNAPGYRYGVLHNKCKDHTKIAEKDIKSNL